jgi:archaellum biogenesis protein FlaJ (TadC family)
LENKKLNQNEKKEYLETLKNILAFLERKAEEKLQNNELSQFVDKELRVKSDIYEKIYGQELISIYKIFKKAYESF